MEKTDGLGPWPRRLVLQCWGWPFPRGGTHSPHALHPPSSGYGTGEDKAEDRAPPPPPRPPPASPAQGVPSGGRERFSTSKLQDTDVPPRRLPRDLGEGRCPSPRQSPRGGCAGSVPRREGHSPSGRGTPKEGATRVALAPCDCRAGPVTAERRGSPGAHVSPQVPSVLWQGRLPPRTQKLATPGPSAGCCGDFGVGVGVSRPRSHRRGFRASLWRRGPSGCFLASAFSKSFEEVWPTDSGCKSP